MSDPFEDGIATDCELQCGIWDSSSGCLEEQPGLITAKPFLTFCIYTVFYQLSLPGFLFFKRTVGCKVYIKIILQVADE